MLLDRYKETRRRHPLAEGGQVSSAIAQERMLLEPLKERADVAIDTSDLSASRLRKVVADKMLPHDGKLGKLAVTFLTYGFKHGTRATPTCCSTCASCRTRTTRTSCAT